MECRSFLQAGLISCSEEGLGAKLYSQHIQEPKGRNPFRSGESGCWFRGRGLRVRVGV